MTEILPMTLGNMRENGVRSLLVTCSNVTCRHEKIVNVDAYGDDLFVPSFGPRMRCERCGQRGARTFGRIGASKRRQLFTGKHSMAVTVCSKVRWLKRRRLTAEAASVLALHFPLLAAS